VVLLFIQGTAKDGAKIKITPKVGRTLIIKSGGNILTSSDITVTDTEFYELIKHSEAETGVTGGAYKILLSGGGAGSLSEPIELGFNEVVTETTPTLTIIAGDVFNPSHITLDQDIELQLDISAATTKYKSIFVIFDTTGGGFTVTWPASVVNPPIIDDSTAQRISVILYTIDNGTLWTHATSVGSSFGGEFFGPWTANHNAGLFDLTNLGNIDFDGVASTIQGLSNLDFFQASHSINSLAGSMLFQVDTSDFLRFFAGGVEIAKFDNTTGLTIVGTHVINMGNNIINTISELQFSISNTHTPSNETTIAFDFTDKELKYAVALITDAHSWYADTDRLASIVRIGTDTGKLFINAIDTDVLTVASQFLIAPSSGVDPGLNGEFRLNGTDVKVFSGGVIRNLSNIGASPSSIIDGNTSAAVSDGAPSFVVVLNGVQKYSISNTRVDFVDLDLFGINQINMTDSSSNDISTLTASPSGLLLNILSTSDVYDIKFNSVDAFHVDNLRTRILSTTPNTTAPALSLFRDDASPVNGDDLGLIKFDGKDSAANFTTYAELSSTIENVTNGLETANFFIKLKQNNIDVDMFRLVNGVMVLRTLNSVANEGAIFVLLKEDNSPGNGDLIAKVQYSILDTSITTIYAETRAEIRDATDAGRYYISVRTDNASLFDALEIIGDDNNVNAFMNINARISSDLVFGVEIGGTDLKIFPQVNTIGLTFDNLSYTVGSAGTNQIPHVDTLPASAAGADAAFGTAQGALGIFDNDVSVFTLFGRQEDGNWAAVTLTRDVLT